MGGLLVVLGLSWEVWCSKNTEKTDIKHIFSISLLFAVVAIWERFWRQCWLILGSFGPQNGRQKSIKIGSKSGSACWSLFRSALGSFWGYCGNQNLLKKETKNGTIVGTCRLCISEAEPKRKREINEGGETSIGT